MSSLNVWMNGELVGTWTYVRTGTAVFRYAESWARSPNARALSLSLPLTQDREIRGDVVDHFFENLLPDNPAILRRLRARFGLRSMDAFDLLEAIGRDCVGAIQLLPPGAEPTRWNRIDAEPLTTAQVERLLRDAVATPTLGRGQSDNDAFRISLAGAQEKTALLSMGGVWHRPRNATPTTHILKLPLGIVGDFRGDFSHSVENEWLCAEILKGLGLAVAECEVARFGEQTALVVSRFDRRWIGVDGTTAAKKGFKPRSGVWIARLPQEDFCQATGRPSRKRYQSDGGPGVEEILDILAASETAVRDRGDFVLGQLAFWILAAPDGHAKNFSIRQLAGGAFSMTPLYDVISAWPVVGRGPRQLPIQDVRLAMGIAGRRRHYKLGEIQPRHWRELAIRVGGDELWIRMRRLAESVATVLDRVQRRMPRGFPEHVVSRIADGVTSQARMFLATGRSA